MHPTQKGKVTLIELGFLTFYILVIAAFLQWGHHRYGWHRVAVFTGRFSALMVGLSLAGFGFVYLMAVIYTGIPYYPTCKTGKCHRNDYQYRRLDNGQRAVFCQCGTLYRKRGRRFFEVQPDGSVRRYMIWKAFKGWIPDG